MEEAIGDIRIARPVIEPTLQQTEALNLLYSSHEIDRELSSLAFRFHQDKDDLRQMLALKLTKKGYTLRSIKCLKPWSFITAKRICINLKRKQEREKRRREARERESVMCKRGGEPIFRYDAETPEERLSEREQEALRNDLTVERLMALREKLEETIASLPPDVREVARLWDKGMSPADIAEKVGKAVPTVYRKHKEFQRAIVKSCGVAESATDEPPTDEPPADKDKDKEEKRLEKQLAAVLQPLASLCLQSSPTALRSDRERAPARPVCEGRRRARAAPPVRRRTVFSADKA